MMCAERRTGGMAADLEGRTLVVGLGRTGLSAIRSLCAQGAEVSVTDTRARPPGLPELERSHPDLPMYLGGFAAEAFVGVSRIVLSPGVPAGTPAVAAARARGVPIWGDVELFARLNRAPVAAITGSNGKSTVTALLGLMAREAGLKAAVGGNIGTPALDLLDDPELVVLELSSFQLESTYSLDAAVATVLNLSPDHLDRYPDLEAYAEAKRRVFAGSGVMVLNADDPRVRAMAEPGRTTVSFTTGRPRRGQLGLRREPDRIWLMWGSEPWIAARELGIGGLHNLANALAALAMGMALNLPRSAMLAALRAFPGLPHRTQRVLEHQGVSWYDDSKGTNVGATAAAIDGLPGPLVLIAGGDGKGQDFAPLREPVARKARAVVLLGRDAGLLEQALEGAAAIERAADMEEAVGRAARLARPGDSVLLSPACASFDMFADYEERGRAFCAAVRGMAGC